nr:hypothetical protein [Tanacetum cinerariifolium]
MITFLNKSDASEGFEQIIKFLNASVIQYALMVNPTIYVSCIKQFWSSVLLKKTNDVVRLQALIDSRKVIITEDTVRQALRLDDADSIDCLPNEEIFDELARMGYEKPSTKVGKGFYGVDTSLFDGMLVPQKVHDDVADADAEPTPPSLTPATTSPTQQELIPSSSQVESTLPSSPHQSLIAPLSSPLPQQPPSHDAAISMDLLNQLLETCATLTKKVGNLEQDKIAQAIEITKLKQRVKKLEKKRKLKASGLKRLRKVGTTQRVESLADTVMDDQEDASKLGGGIAKLDADEDVTLEEVAAEVAKDADVQGRLEESQAHLMTEVVTATATTITAAPMPKASAARRRKDVVIRDPEETATPSVIVHFEPKSKDKGKGILNEVIEQVKRKKKQDNTVMRYQGLKRKPQTEARELEEEASKQSKRKGETSEEKTAKKHKLEKEVEELKTHLQIVSNDEDDMYTEATPLALKVPVVDYQIHNEHNKPYYKIIRADGTHQLFLSFLSLLRNFKREDLEMLWKIVQEKFTSSEPKNFSDEFLLNTLKAMFEKPNVEASI